MATLWRKTMYHLGLAPDEEYDDYDDADYDERGYEEPAPRRESQLTRRSHAAVQPAPMRAEQTSIGAVRPIRATESSEPSIVPEPAPHRSPVVRPVPVSANAKPHAMAPVTFNDAQELADKLKGSQPVIMNLQNADRDLSRRLIDFASGLCYGIDGQMERVADHVYLMTPSDVEVSVEERRRMEEQDFTGR